MKKHLIAMAVSAAIAGPALAQNVSVYGLIDTSYRSDSTNALASDVVTKTRQTGADGQLSGSRLGFRGTEDLGGGLKAGFVVEFGLSTTEALNGINNGTRLGYIELSGGMGSLRAGRQVSPTKFVNDNYTTFGNSTFNIGNITGGTATADTTNFLHNATAGDRVNNALTYISPTFMGLSIQLQVSNDTTKTGGAETTRQNTDSSATADRISSSPNQKNAGATYSFGPVALAVGRVNSQDIVANVNTRTKNDALGVIFTATDALKIYGTVNKLKTDVDGVKSGDRDDTTIGIDYAVGNWNLKAAYSTGENDTIAAGVTTTRDQNGYQLGAVYNFSKRTNAYVVYGDSQSKTNGTALEAQRDGFVTGVRHNF